MYGLYQCSFGAPESLVDTYSTYEEAKQAEEEAFMESIPYDEYTTFFIKELK